MQGGDRKIFLLLRYFLQQAPDLGLNDLLEGALKAFIAPVALFLVLQKQSHPKEFQLLYFSFRKISNWVQ